jgi:hypothetical protein
MREEALVVAGEQFALRRDHIKAVAGSPARQERMCAAHHSADPQFGAERHDRPQFGCLPHPVEGLPVGRALDL